MEKDIALQNRNFGQNSAKIFLCENLETANQLRNINNPNRIPKDLEFIPLHGAVVVPKRLHIPYKTTGYYRERIYSITNGYEVVHYSTSTLSRG